MPNVNHEIKELVFNGGGARGVGMPGVYYALKNSNAWEKEGVIWDGIETLAGASVGALTAGMFSVGPDFDDFNEEIINKNPIEILGIEKDILPFHFAHIHASMRC